MPQMKLVRARKPREGESPEDIARECIARAERERATNLYLSNLGLMALPPEIGRLTSLNTLSLARNRLTALPPEIGRLTSLTALFVVNNQLTALPPALRDLTALGELYLHGNDALSLPPEVLGPSWQDVHRTGQKKAAKPADILDYYFRGQVEAKRRLNEAKLLVVGPEAVGKTSLVNYLLHDQPCDPHEPKTPGVIIRERINVESWRLPGPPQNGAQPDAVNLNVWDFGGQEIMYETHQFFLSARSLYLLVLEARREDDDSILYWLKTIQNRAGDAPVIVVINKAEPPHELRLDEPRLRRQYPNVRAFIRTSCLPAGRGIAELRQLIHAVVHSELPHVRDEFPSSYFAVKEELAVRARQNDVVDVATYHSLCAEQGINKESEQRGFLRLLDQIGVVVAHTEAGAPDSLHKMTLLNPNWITQGVYRLLTHTAVRGAGGELDFKCLGDLLGDPQAYPQPRWRFIIDMMETFGLCFEIPHTGHQRYLIPEQLTPQEPDVNWPEEDAPRLRYDYKLLPPGLIARFIVEAHQNLTKKRTAWHNGVLLAADGCEVLVRADRDRRAVDIWVQGPVRRRRGALAVVRNHFAAVHRLNPAAAPQEKVPLPDRPELNADYETLLKMEAANRDEYWPDGADHEYSVRDLLDGVEPAEDRAARRQETRSADGDVHVMVNIDKKRQVVARDIKGSKLNLGDLEGSEL